MRDRQIHRLPAPSRNPLQGLALLAVLLCVATLLQPQADHPLISFARVVGYFLVSAAFSLGLLLFWRFGTQLGRRLPFGQAFNVFCGVTAAMYLVGAVLRSVLPSP